jgi:hypothetical protein
MVGAILVVLAVVVVLPVSFLVGGGIVAAVFGASLTSAKAKDFEGSELVDLN